MIVSSLNTLFKRDLEKLLVEIESYRVEANLWQLAPHISNTAGNLCMHLTGNLNTYIGARLGQTGYVRDRPFEFAGKDIPRATLVSQIRDTIQVVDTTLSKLTDRDLEKEYPEDLPSGKTSTGQFLMHLAMHLSYHLGQIDYHRRLLDV